MHEPGSMDISQHRSVYGAFTGLVKWGVIGCIVLLALMAIFLV
ncbi:aa3-type cytochrome c oxidase subunit IV [Minwuia thermotolerans]|nr:aa3-type cytochrome c oxidase subunit IV [Minwuia thermotolerans]